MYLSQLLNLWFAGQQSYPKQMIFNTFVSLFIFISETVT